MDESSQAVLLIAYISGFTKFMRLHALTTSHARQIMVRLSLSMPLTRRRQEGR